MMNKKRLLALLLAVVMVIGMIPTVWAADGDAATSELVLDKWATDNKDGTFTLTMESYVTGSKDTVEQVTRIPADIVLVLDESGSMDNCIKCGLDKCEGKDNYQPIYSGKMDTDKVSSYYYRLNDESDTEYYAASYCATCQKWLNRATKNHENGDHSAGTERAPKEGKDDAATDHYQYYTYCEHEERYVSLNNAVNTFLNNIYAEAKGKDNTFGTADDVQHRVAIVGFGDKGHLRTYVNNANANTGTLGSGWLGSTTDSTALKKADKVDDYDGLNGYLHVTDWLNSDGTLNSDRSRYLRLLRWATVEADRNALTNAKNAIGLDNGSTYTELGLDAARAIFAFTNNPYKGKNNIAADVTGRNRVVVMFTDGAPTHNQAYFSNANTAISYANDLKNKYKASVYTVGIFTGADSSGTALPTYYDYSSGKLYPDSTNATNSAKGIDLANRFMQLVSSNYKSATAMEDGKTGSKTSSNYYMAATNADELRNVFQRISNDITNDSVKVQYDESTILKDIVTESFYIPNGATSVTAYTETFDGLDSNGDRKWKTASDDKTYEATVDGRTVTVTGFDYTENYVGLDSYTNDNNQTTKTPHGKKMVVEVKIKPNDDFLGGNNVPTNTSDSGIYGAGGFVPFPEPDVDVPIKVIDPKFKNDAIYVSQVASLPNLSNIGKFTLGTGDNAKEYSVDGINNAYVKITYTIQPDGSEDVYYYTIPAGTKLEDLDFGQGSAWKDADGNALTDSVVHLLLINDASYKLECHVDPISEGTATGTKAEATATIKVFKPQLIFKDTSANLGTPVSYDGNPVEAVVWKNNGASPTDTDKGYLGAEPNLQLTFTPLSGTSEREIEGVTQTVIADDVPVQVNVISPMSTHSLHKVTEDTDISIYTTFLRQACTFPGCTHINQTTVKAEVGKSWTNFVIHPNAFDLVIHKEGCQAIDENQSFVFEVTGPDGFAIEVTIVGNGSVTIKDLVPGEYTVKELQDWSWRYEAKDPDVTFTASKDVEEVKFENIRKKDKWLSGDSWAKNLFNGTPATKSN